MPPRPSETEAKARAQRGRGRLSSLEMLPEAADEALAWANAELRERRMPQAEILRRMNAMLADHGIAPVSVGAFSRHSIRLAIEMRKLQATRAATTAVLDRLPKGERSDATQAAVELVKFRLAEMIMAADDPDPKFLASASLALMRLTSTTLLLANAERQDRKDQREQDEQERLQKERDAAREQAEAIETADTVERIATEAGLSAERVAAIRKGVLGLAG